MSLILQALKRAKEMAERKPAVVREEATLRSFGFKPAPPERKIQRVIVWYLAPALILGIFLAIGLQYWLTRESAPVEAEPRAVIDRAYSEPAPLEVVPPVPSNLRVEPTPPDPFELGVYYQKNGDYRKAFEAYRQVLEKNPLNAFVLNNVGLLHQATSNNAEAIKAFRSAISIDEKYDKAHNNLGTSLLREGQDAEAAREFQRALDLNPNNADARTNLGNLARKAGQVELAKTHFLMALQVNPTMPETHYNLALLYDEQGETRMAVSHFRKFLQYGSNLYPGIAAEVEKNLTK